MESLQSNKSGIINTGNICLMLLAICIYTVLKYTIYQLLKQKVASLTGADLGFAEGRG